MNFKKPEKSASWKKFALVAVQKWKVESLRASASGTGTQTATSLFSEPLRLKQRFYSSTLPARLLDLGIFNFLFISHRD